MTVELDIVQKRRHLLCLNTALIPRKIEIGKDKFVVGSKDNVDLSVPSESVKTEHAIIRLTGPCCYVMMLNPDGVTCVNKDTLIKDERRALRSQDTISFGDVKYRYIESVV